MEKTTRRNLLRAAAAGGVAATGIGAVLGSERAVAALAAAQQGSGGSGNQDGDDHDHGRGNDRPLTGRRAQATVSFGQWDANNFDRFPVNSDRTRNIHELLPFEVEIDAGGAVSFIISGVHQVLIYDDGTTLEDLQARVARDGAILPIGPGLVDHELGRLFRGLNPFALFYRDLPATPPATMGVPLMVQDRIESVNFPMPGRFLVVCGVLPHFNEGMHGFVRVRKHD